MSPPDRPVRLVATMIVRDEAPTIERCLRSLVPLVSAFCVVDTGSTDDTFGIVDRFLDDHEGLLHRRAWGDFASNRSEALELARPLGTHSLTIDADEEVVFSRTATVDEVLATIHADVHPLEIRNPTAREPRMAITSTARQFVYRGVVGEVLDGVEDFTLGAQIQGIWIKHHRDGVRHREADTPIRDAHLLEAALQRGDDPLLRQRYTFLLAEAWAKAGNLWRALLHYEERTRLGGLEDEVYLAWLYAGHVLWELERPVGQILEAYEGAHAALSTRAESLYYAAKAARTVHDFERAIRYAEQGLAIPQPNHGIRIEPDVYAWRLAYELVLSCTEVGQTDRALELAAELLKRDDLADDAYAALHDLRRTHAEA